MPSGSHFSNVAKPNPTPVSPRKTGRLSKGAAPISFGFDSTRNRVRFHNANAIDASAAVPVIGWDAAAEVVDGWLPWLPSSVAKSPEYLSLKNPVTSQIVEASSLQAGVTDRPSGYLFALFRSVNGVPVLNFENIAVVSRTGTLEYLQLTGDGDLALEGPPGSEVPVDGSIFTARKASYDTIVGRFGQDFREFFGANWSPKIQFSETVYLVDPGGTSLSQYHLFIFVPSGPKESVGRLQYWAYSVLEASPVRRDYTDWKVVNE